MNIYWDQNFRTSHWVLIDAFRDFRAWLEKNNETREVVIQLDNLPEHCSLDFQTEMRRLKIKPLYLPAYSTDVGSVVDYDIGRKDKDNIKKAFRQDFSDPLRRRYYFFQVRWDGQRRIP